MIRHKELKIQNLRIFILLIGVTIGTIIFALSPPHCHVGHDDEHHHEEH